MPLYLARLLSLHSAALPLSRSLLAPSLCALSVRSCVRARVCVRAQTCVCDTARHHCSLSALPPPARPPLSPLSLLCALALPLARALLALCCCAAVLCCAVLCACLPQPGTRESDTFAHKDFLKLLYELLIKPPKVFDGPLNSLHCGLSVTWQIVSRRGWRSRECQYRARECRRETAGARLAASFS